MARYAYVNGQYVDHRTASVHIEDRGYQLADGVYEVVGVRDGRLIVADAASGEGGGLNQQGHVGRRNVCPVVVDHDLVQLALRGRREHGIEPLVELLQGEPALRVVLPQARGRCLAVGVPIDEIGPGLAGFDGVRGRLERVDLGQDFSVFIDFAHSAGALASALAELRPYTQGRLIAVFGSTARSDHDRPGMGKAAADLADFFVITTDDPLREDPMEIARDVQSGAAGKAPGRDYEIVIDRRAAIRRAIDVAKPGDTVLLAGKGHERTMQMAAGAEPWDERAEAEAAIKEKAGAR